MEWQEWIKDGYECSECGEIVNEVLEVGEDLDYESRTAFLCRNCLIKICALQYSSNPPFETAVFVPLKKT